MNNNLGGSYYLTKDIDCSDTINWNSGTGFVPVGSSNFSPFTGSFNGKGYKITDLYINRPSERAFIGLFGSIRNANIDNVGLENVNINNLLVEIYKDRRKRSKFTDYNIVGGLVGYSGESIITNSYVTGSVLGRDNVGGLVGVNINSTITNSYATGSVRGNHYVGGLVGEIVSASTITNSYATNSVRGVFYVGGLVGIGRDNASKVVNCYAVGPVSYASRTGALFGEAGSTIITKCYWNINTSGQREGSGNGSRDYDDEIIGKTTAQMKTKSTFASWNFSSIWYMPNGKYPVLRWQIPTCSGCSVLDDKSLTCIAGSSCAAGKTCSVSDTVGICKNCTVNTKCTCPSGQLANGSGRCVTPVCKNDAACGAGKTCINDGKHNAYCKNCTVNTKCTCPSGKLANGSGRCVIPVCKNDAACGAGKTCINDGKHNAYCTNCKANTQCTCPSNQLATGTGSCRPVCTGCAVWNGKACVAGNTCSGELPTCSVSNNNGICVCNSGSCTAGRKCSGTVCVNCGSSEGCGACRCGTSQKPTGAGSCLSTNSCCPGECNAVTGANSCSYSDALCAGSACNRKTLSCCANSLPYWRRSACKACSSTRGLSGRCTTKGMTCNSSYNCVTCAANTQCTCPRGQLANGSGGCVAPVCSRNSDCAVEEECVKPGTFDSYCSNCRNYNKIWHNGRCEACPANSTYTKGVCLCSGGKIWNKSVNSCLDRGVLTSSGDILNLKRNNSNTAAGRYESIKKRMRRIKTKIGRSAGDKSNNEE